MSDPALVDEFDRARSLVREGRLAEAERAYRDLLERLPDSVEALNLVGARLLARQEFAAAVPLLERARACAPDDAETLKNVGVAYRANDRLAEARDALQAAVTNDPDYFLARLHLGGVLQALGRDDDALAAWFRAIHDAQAQGRWLDEATTPPGLRPTVIQAMRFVNAGRPRLFDAALAPLRAKYGANALQRVEHGLALYLGDTVGEPPDPRQRPKFFYLPGLPSTPYHERALFPWLDELESQTGAIRTELLSMLAADQGFEPFLKFESAAQADGYLRGSRGEPAWNGFFFHRHGQRNDTNCARCPVTSDVLDRLPIVRIRDHAPEILFSVLTPGSHILPHHGVTNVRLVTHLPLVVPSDCALRVGGVEHAWQEGRCVVFDDTYEHEAWNRSEHTRVVLIFDTWNPYLGDVEREALTDLIETIGEFNQRAGVH